MRRDRDTLPLFFNGDDLVWVVGHSISDRVKVSPSTLKVLHISVEKFDDKETI
jgi:hypothetical protein